MNAQAVQIDPEQLVSGIVSKERRLPQWAAIYRRSAAVAMTLLALAAVMDVASLLGMVFYRQQYLAVFLGLGLSLTFIAVPARKRPGLQAGVPWWDVLFAILSLVGTGYVAVMYPHLLTQLSRITTEHLILGAVTLGLLFEALRRLTGWVLVITVGMFVAYAHFSYLAPGFLGARSSSWERIVTFLYLDPNSQFGPTLDVIFGVVLPFVLFGGLLYMAGGGRILNDLALWAFGRFRGGPAKMTAGSGALFGSMSGSAAANVVISGVFTIPLMKRMGYRPEFAAAVEATSSSGGVLAPPVMGAAAFLMAEFLGIPYGQVATAAIIPAVLYYLSGFFQIDFEAARLGLRGLRADELPSMQGIWKDALFFVAPLGTLCYLLLVLNLSPQRAALYASVLVVVIALLRPQFRIGPRSLLRALENAGTGSIQMAVIGAAAGLILGVLTLKGSGSIISQALVVLAGGSVVPLLIVAAIACIILGMGLPAVAIYVLLAVLVAPALVGLGVDPLAAHLFIFYCGIFSYVTPPMAFACFVAAPIAGCSPFKAGLQAMRLCAVAYVVPFLFVFYPVLLMRGSWTDILYAFASAVAGTWVLAAVVAGYLHRHLHWIERLFLLVIGTALLLPELWASIVGGGLLALYLGADRLVRTRLAQPEANERNDPGSSQSGSGTAAPVLRESL